jgi:hypothetical protein
MREWLEMFAGPHFENLSADRRARAFHQIENRLRDKLWREGAWWADYRRLRVLAVR